MRILLTKSIDVLITKSPWKKSRDAKFDVHKILLVRKNTNISILLDQESIEYDHNRITKMLQRSISSMIIKLSELSSNSIHKNGEYPKFLSELKGLIKINH